MVISTWYAEYIVCERMLSKVRINKLLSMSRRLLKKTKLYSYNVSIAFSSTEPTPRPSYDTTNSCAKKTARRVILTRAYKLLTSRTTVQKHGLPLRTRP